VKDRSISSKTILQERALVARDREARATGTGDASFLRAMSILPLLRALCVLLGIFAAFVVLRTWNSFDASRPSMSRGTSWLHGASGPLRSGGKG